MKPRREEGDKGSVLPAWGNWFCGSKSLCSASLEHGSDPIRACDAWVALPPRHLSHAQRGQGIGREGGRVRGHHARVGAGGGEGAVVAVNTAQVRGRVFTFDKRR